jgi:hypothetical protein
VKFAVESWAPEYGTSADQNQFEDATGDVDVNVEIPAERWAPRWPADDAAAPERILFVDGVRRVDAQVWFDDGGITRAGVCASVAAGSVHCAAGVASVLDVVVERGFFARSSPHAGPIATHHGTYQYVALPEDGPPAVNQGMQDLMTDVEVSIAAGHDVDLVVYDGPLRQRNDPRAVGYVKTQHVQYLPDELQAMVGRLAAGQRTPLFLMGGRGTRYSWYLRLPGPQPQPMAGVVRCEVMADRLADAVMRADTITSTLPRYASEAHKDPRAPQNLYPIAGLEHRLRHLLGDQQLMERALRRAAAGTLSTG